MLELHGEVNKGKWCLSIEQKEMHRRFFESRKDGSRIVGIFKQERKPKSWSQVKCHFGLVVSTIYEEFDRRGIDTSYILGGDIPTGNPVSKEMIHECLYSWCPMYAEDGDRIRLSDERCTTNIAAIWFEAICNYMSSKFGIYIPEPDKNWKEKKE